MVESFSFFVSVPKKGGYKLKVHDLSEIGIGFDLDIPGEGASVPVKEGDTWEVHFYLNQTLYLPLTVKIARLLDREGVRYAGAEFPDRSTAPYHAIESLLKMLDQLADVAVLKA
ncbi:MAG: PilZ domain-containing protein [Bdellovibrionales bacterium]|nr:PilZ domain-containing protein [Bdellovibrionales bacterium]